MIQVNTPVIGDLEKEYVSQCMQSGWISSTGLFVNEFESAWARYCGCEYGVAVTNGTHALELAIAALQLPKGSEIILPSFTIISCAIAAIRNGLKPVLVDADPYTWCMDIDAVKSVITCNTTAIMPVHMYGYPVDMSQILEIASKNNLEIVEDAAEAHGAECLIQQEKTWKKCGGIGDIGCFSFYGNKIITTGEGGMAITNDKILADRMRSIRNLCFGKGENRFTHTGVGNNFRMTNIQAAIGLGQVSRIHDILQQKQTISSLYRNQLSDLGDIFQFPPLSQDALNVHWMFGIVSRDPKRPASYFIDGLQKRGIESRPFFTGLHRQPLGLTGDFPVCDKLSKYGFYIPSGVGLTISDLNSVCSALKELV